MKTNRIPFSLEKYESGKYKVVTRNGSRFNSECISEDDLFLEEVTFEDGDIIKFGYNRIGILKEICNEFSHSDYITLTEESLSYMLRDGWTNHNIRLATEEEKKRLFDALKKDGKCWNAEKKCVEDIKKEYQFKPFDKVLVRDNNSAKWRIDIFSNLSRMPDYPYLCVGGGWSQCIPYEGNEKLLGTNTSK